MELHGSGYLFNLSVVATTFAGFAGLTVIFREILGGKLTRLDGFVIRTFIQLGFLATLGSIVPPLLHLFELSPPTIWRAASIAMAFLLGAWSFSFPKRRHAASPTPAPLPIWITIIVLDAAVLERTYASVLLSPPAPEGEWHAPRRLTCRGDSAARTPAFATAPD